MKNNTRHNSNKTKASRLPARTAKISLQGKKELIEDLNGDLSREYKAIIQYVVFSAALKGPEYGDIAAQLKEHAKEELSHALDLARQIDYLGGIPTISIAPAKFSKDSKKMLQIDLKAEQDTIKNYGRRILQAEAAGEFGLSETLRKIVSEEQDHEMDLKNALGMKQTPSLI